MSYPDYIAPSSLEEALGLLGDTNRKASVLAGGTNLIPRLRTKEIEPLLVVDIRRLPLINIEVRENYLHLGAGVSCSQIIEDDLVIKHFPGLVKACQAIGSPALRNRITLGGNIAASLPEANTVPTLLVYDAVLCVAKGRSERTVPVSDFYLDTGKCILESGELITEIRMLIPPLRTATSFQKFGYRRGMAISIVNVVVRISVDQNGYIHSARIALGAFSQKPIRAPAVENMLVGTSLREAPSDSLVRLAVESYPARTDLFAGAAYRKKLATVLIYRALREAYTDLGGIDFHG